MRGLCMGPPARTRADPRRALRTNFERAIPCSATIRHLEPSEIDEIDLEPPAEREPRDDRVARRPALGRRDHARAADERIEETALAGVRRTGEDDARPRRAARGGLRSAQRPCRRREPRARLGDRARGHRDHILLVGEVDARLDAREERGDLVGERRRTLRVAAARELAGGGEFGVAGRRDPCGDRLGLVEVEPPRAVRAEREFAGLCEPRAVAARARRPDERRDDRIDRGRRRDARDLERVLAGEARARERARRDDRQRCRTAHRVPPPASLHGLIRVVMRVFAHLVASTIPRDRIRFIPRTATTRQADPRHRHAARGRRAIEHRLDHRRHRGPRRAHDRAHAAPGRRGHGDDRLAVRVPWRLPHVVAWRTHLSAS